MDDEPVIDDQARAVGVDAVQRARAEGCDCVPDVKLHPMPASPWWFPIVEHDKSCTFVRLHATDLLLPQPGVN